MTLDAFDAGGRFDHPCRECFGVGMAAKHYPNNNSLRVLCPHCGSETPWGRRVDLTHSAKPHRKDDAGRAGCSLAEVWAAGKQRCSVCTLPIEALVVLGIGCSRHHVTERYDPAEVDCPIRPVCTACKPFVDARQREAWRWFHRLQECLREPVPHGGAGVPRARLRSDSVRPAREAPAGPVEGRAVDDALT